MKLIYVCSPLAGDIKNNIEKAKRYCKEVIQNDLIEQYIPIAPHIYFTQFLDDLKPEDRQLGLKCGLELLKICDELWVYGDHTKSLGMTAEVEWWKNNKKEAPIIWLGEYDGR